MSPLPGLRLRRSARVATALPAALAAVLLVASCGAGDDSDGTSADDPSDAPSASDTPSTTGAEPSATAPATTDSPEASTAPPSSADPSGTPFDDTFLTAGEMPGLNDQTVWADAGTQPEGSEPFGDCAKFTLVDAGADEAWVRTFTSDGTQHAAQLIARFADAKSAWRAEQVLRGWHRDCGEQLDANVEKVNALRPATVATGKSFTYLLQYGPQDAELHHFNGVAVNRKGPLISVVLIDVESQDYNYPSGQEPAQQAAQAVAAKLP